MAKLYPAEIVRIDRSFFQIPGFFYETAMGKREEPKVIRQEMEGGKTLEISRPANLGAFHLLLLEALAAEAQRGKSLRKAGEKDNPLVSISYYRLAKCMGMGACTTLRKQIDLALSELEATRLVWLDEAGKVSASCNLLSVAEPSPDGERTALRISLCPLLSSPDVHSSALINMNEARSLKHRASLLLHGWLSSRALPGRQTTAAVSDLLEGVIWPKLAENRSSTRRTRKSVLLNKILPDLVGAGWKADIDSEKEKIRFRRPMLPEQAYGEPARERYSYRVFWSDEDSGYLAVCDQFPGLSCAEAEPEKALSRIVRLLSEHAEDCAHA